MDVEHVTVNYVEIDNRVVAAVLAFILIACFVAAYLWLRRSR
jgi:hypothetical protein